MPPPFLRTLRAAALPLLAMGASAIGACAWSVPADPSRNALLRSRTSADAAFPSATTDASGRAARVQALGGAGSDDGARAVYLARCGQCHAPWPTTHATADEWPGYVAKYGPRAGLFGAERQRVLRWLQANAR